MPELLHRADPRRPGRHHSQPRAGRRRLESGRPDPARLDPARLDQARLDQARLDQARLDPARLDPARLDQARLDQARLDQAARLDQDPATPPDGVQPGAGVASLLAQAREGLGLPSATAPQSDPAPAAQDPAPTAAHPTGGRHSRTGQTQPLPVVPSPGGPARHRTSGTADSARRTSGTADSARHRTPGGGDAARHRTSAPARRPVGRSLVGALAVIGVVGGVEMTAASLTGGAGQDTASGPVTDPATLSGLHALAPQFTPTQPGPDDRRPAADAVPAPRPAADDRVGGRVTTDGPDIPENRDTDERGTDRDERPGDDRVDDRNAARDGAGTGVRAAKPKLPDLPGLDLPGLLPKRKAANPANCGKPGKILNLANWKLTLPTGSSGKPTEVLGSALGALTNSHFGTDNKCDAVAFRAPVNGATTSGSKNPRSELREMTGSGSGKAGWSSSSGTHTMKVTEAFTRLPSGKPHLVGAQIHDASDDVSVFRLEGTKLWVTNGDNPNFKLADANYKLGTPFEAKFVVSGGQTRAFYNGKLVATIAKSYSGAYFKAGAYTQANCGNAPCSSDNYGETLIYDLDVTHT